jgi:hypothetical protein
MRPRARFPGQVLGRQLAQGMTGKSFETVFWPALLKP